MQNYLNIRETLIPRKKLDQLSLINPIFPIIHVFIHWVLILTFWISASIWDHYLYSILAIIGVGINFYGLYIIGHDGLHRKLFKDINVNDLFNDILILGSIGAITRINRINHIEHHLHTALEDDPDKYKYEHNGKDPFINYFLFLLGIKTLLTSFKNIFVKPLLYKKRKNAKTLYKLRDITILISWQLFLIIFLTYLFGWFGYIFYWIIPVYIFSYRADIVRVFCEHSTKTPDVSSYKDLRLVSFESNFFEKLFFAPHNMNCHISHHLWTSIPYYNLNKAEKLIFEKNENFKWRKSYISYLKDYLLWRIKS